MKINKLLLLTTALFAAQLFLSPNSFAQVDVGASTL